MDAWGSAALRHPHMRWTADLRIRYIGVPLSVLAALGRLMSPAGEVASYATALGERALGDSITSFADTCQQWEVYRLADTALPSLPRHL